MPAWRCVPYAALATCWRLNPKMRSIRLSLLKWLLLPLLLLNLVGAAGTYWLAWRPTARL